MNTRKLLIGTAAVVGAGAVWFLFRPELLFINKSVNESLPGVESASASTMELAAGKFKGIAHETKGMAAVYQVGGKRILRLTDFETSNGPDVHVLLVANADPKDNDTVKKAGFLDLGSIKGNQGDQNYDLPAEADLARYRAVTIWCKRFQVNFGTAPLSAVQAAAGPRQLAQGKFHGAAHETKGEASIYEVNGKPVLRLSDFETSNGPDVHVLLGSAADAKDNDTVTKAGFLDLGSIKGNKGDQNYELPSGTDLAKFHSVTIWCKRFGVNFGTAPLAGSQSASR
jgi:hypothetical protein